jgi:RNA polymerase II subunit A-like phosphatase
MSSPTDVYLPQTFSYPIKVVSLAVSSPSYIQRGARLLTYSFSSTAVKPETRFGTWDSAFEGELNSWKIKPGDVISERRAKEQPALLIMEPCKHGVQIGGLCGLCGKDMTECVPFLASTCSCTDVIAAMITMAFRMLVGLPFK